MHRHVSHLSQKNKQKAHAKKSGGKVEDSTRTLSGTAPTEMGKEQRWNQQVQLRKQKRDDLLMKRRGLNFITDQHEQNLDEASIDVVEKEVDNVAPKIIGLLGLNSDCDTKILREQLTEYCQELMHTKDEMEESDPLKAYNCPNAGSSNNLSSKKQRLIFIEIDRNDIYSVLDVGKVADMVLMVMSCKGTDESQLIVNPDKSSGAIDEQGYKAL